MNPAYRSSIKRNPLFQSSYGDYAKVFEFELMRYEDSRLNSLLQNLLNANKAAGKSNLGFLYNGKSYSPYTDTQLQKANIRLKPIHSTLENEAEHYAFLANKLEQDSQYVYQHLSVLLLKCKSKQDVRDALPDAVVEPFAEFSGMTRTRPEGFIVSDNPLLKKQFSVFQDIVRYYISNRLIYS